MSKNGPKPPTLGYPCRIAKIVLECILFDHAILTCGTSLYFVESLQQNIFPGILNSLTMLKDATKMSMFNMNLPFFICLMFSASYLLHIKNDI